jgi:hypothetical protein
MTSSLDAFQNGDIGFIEGLDLFRFDLALCVILEYPCGTSEQEADNYDAEDR